MKITIQTHVPSTPLKIAAFAVLLLMAGCQNTTPTRLASNQPSSTSEAPRKSGRSTEAFVLIIMKLETIAQLKSACEERLPQYTEQNQRIWNASSLGGVTSEALVHEFSSPEQKEHLLWVISQDRANAKDAFSKMDGKNLDQRCANFSQVAELKPSKQK